MVAPNICEFRWPVSPWIISRDATQNTSFASGSSHSKGRVNDHRIYRFLPVTLVVSIDSVGDIAVTIRGRPRWHMALTVTGAVNFTTAVRLQKPHHDNGRTTM